MEPRAGPTTVGPFRKTSLAAPIVKLPYQFNGLSLPKVAADLAALAGKGWPPEIVIDFAGLAHKNAWPERSCACC
jgi:hypothetical protein